jgi:hypothetical protein
LLRSILRQDPDVIMVGEIRDLETAQIAVQASLTGHLVLSTLHTNSAAATITRLRDMGVEDYLLTAVLRGVLAQRLVRRLCPIAGARPAPPEMIERFDLDRRCDGTADHAVASGRLPAMPRHRLSRPPGDRRIPGPNDEIERLIFARADHGAIERAAVAAAWFDVRRRARCGPGRRHDGGRSRALDPRRELTRHALLPLFAVDAQGQVQRGTMEAPDQATVIDRLQRQGHIRCARSRPPAGGARTEI